MKVSSVLLIVVSVIVVFIGAVGFFLLFFDVDAVISQVIGFAEKELYLAIEYNFTGKNILSLIRGFEFKDVKVYSKLDKKQFLFASDRVYLGGSVVNLIFGNDVGSIKFEKSSVDVENLINYLTSDKIKQKVYGEGVGGDGKVILNSLVFDDIDLIYQGNKYKFRDVSLEFDKFRLKGYWVDGRSKFLFDGTNFTIDKIDAGRFVKGVFIDNISGKIEEGNKFYSAIRSFSYSNVGRFNNLVVNGNLDKMNFDVLIKESVFYIDKDTFSFDNLRVNFEVGKVVKGGFKVSEKIFGNFSLGDGFVGEVNVRDVSEKDLPKTIFYKVSNVFESLNVSGSVKVLVSDNIKLYGRLGFRLITTFTQPLLKNIEGDVKFNGDDFLLNLYSKTPRSDVNIVSSLFFDTTQNIVMKDLKVYSKRLNFLDIYSSNAQVDTKNKKNENIFLGVIISNCNVEVYADSVVFGDIPNVYDISLVGKLGVSKGYMDLSFDVRGIRFANVGFSGVGELSYSDNVSFRLKFSPSYFELPILLSGLGFTYGKVYGKGILKDFEIYFDEDIVARGRVSVSNVELISVPIQNEITRLLNLNLDHVFIDGDFDFEFKGNVLRVVGKVVGDVVSEFDVVHDFGKNVAKFSFKYLDIDRGIVENIPKIFFIRNEINGIRFKMGERYLSFEKFEVEIK